MFFSTDDLVPLTLKISRYPLDSGDFIKWLRKETSLDFLRTIVQETVTDSDVLRRQSVFANFKGMISTRSGH